MFDDKLSYITLSGEKYPMRCGMEVLEIVQDKYGSIEEFENRLMPFERKKDENGEDVLNEEGVPIGRYVIPKISDLGDALHLMVTAGLEMEADLSGKETESVTRKELLQKADMPPTVLGEILHAEMMRCFRRKNGTATQEKETTDRSK